MKRLAENKKDNRERANKHVLSNTHFSFGFSILPFGGHGFLQAGKEREREALLTILKCFKNNHLTMYCKFYI